MARVARKYGIKANQVFHWRRLYRDCKLGVASESAMKLLPVCLADGEELLKPEQAEVVSSGSGAIHIKLPGEVRIRLEGSVDPAMVRAVLKSLHS